MKKAPTLQEKIGALVSPRLLELLAEAHPIRPPKVDDSLAAIQRAAGVQDHIAFLASCHRINSLPDDDD